MAAVIKRRYRRFAEVSYDHLDSTTALISFAESLVN